MGTDRVTRPAPVRSATVEIASIVCRLTCRYDKPVLWAEQFPELRSARPADVHIDVTYARAQRRLPWIGDGIVADRPDFRAHRDHCRLRTSYYEARLEDRARRVRVRMQPGFGIEGLMRALWTILLDERDAMLVRARRLVDDDGAVLVVPGDACVALARRDGEWDAFATPFGAADAACTSAGARLRALQVGAPARTLMSRADALRRAVVLVDRRPESVERTLDRVLDVARRVPGDVPRAHANV
jgi:hypothetical protein